MTLQSKPSGDPAAQWTTAVRADEWKSAGASDFLSLVTTRDPKFSLPAPPSVVNDAGVLESVREVVDATGTVVGRLALVPAATFYDGAVVTAGIARTDTRVPRFVGVLLGQPDRASRESAIPLVDLPTVAAAFETDLHNQVQAQLQQKTYDGFLAAVALPLGIDMSFIPAYLTSEGWLTSAQLAERIDGWAKVYAVRAGRGLIRRVGRGRIRLRESVVLIPMTLGGRLRDSNPSGNWQDVFRADLGGLDGALAKILAEAWNMRSPIFVGTKRKRIGKSRDGAVRQKVSVVRRPDV